MSKVKGHFKNGKYIQSYHRGDASVHQNDLYNNRGSHAKMNERIIASGLMALKPYWKQLGIGILILMGLTIIFAGVNGVKYPIEISYKENFTNKDIIAYDITISKSNEALHTSPTELDFYLQDSSGTKFNNIRGFGSQKEAYPGSIRVVAGSNFKNTIYFHKITGTYSLVYKVNDPYETIKIMN